MSYASWIVCCEPAISGSGLVCDYSAFAYVWTLAEDGLDLARLNTETTDFHLRVHASKELDAAIALPAADIASAIHLRARSF